MPGKVKDQVVDPKQWESAKMISIGHIARTYGLLPSEVLARATTYDIMITDVYSTWENYQKDPNATENYSQEQLLELVNMRKAQ